jgi:hypothetical protein
MIQGDFGILVQISGNSVPHGVPTWNGVSMVVVIDRSNRPEIEGDISIYRTAFPTPEGSTTIVRGSGVSRCDVLRVSGVQLFGEPVRDTDGAGGQGVAGVALSVDGVTTKDFLVTVNTFDKDEFQGHSELGPQTIIVDGLLATSNPDVNCWVGYAINQSGTVNLGWDITDVADGSGVCAAFVGGVGLLGPKGII